MRCGNEKGNVSVLAVIGTVFLCLVLTLALGLETAYSIRARAEEDLACARTSAQGTGFMLTMKNAEDPALLFASQIVRSLRRNACVYRLKIYFAESTCADLPGSVRAIACMMVLYPEWKGHEMPCSSYVLYIPYSQGKTWKPETYQRGASQMVETFEYERESSAPTRDTIALSDAPDGLSEKLAEAEQKALQQED